MKSLNYICEYLFELFSLFNKFYNNINIFNEKDKTKENIFALTKLVYNVINNLLNILAIDEVELLIKN